MHQLHTLSKLKVLVRENDQPASKPRRIIAELVVGIAEARVFKVQSCHVNTEINKINWCAELW